MKPKSLFTLLFCLLLLTGCVKGDLNINLKDLNNVEMNAQVLLPKNFFTSYNTSIDELKEMLENNGLENWEKENIETSINGVTYLGLKLIAPKDINDNLLSFFYINEDDDNFFVNIDLNKINQLYDISEIEDISNYSIEDLKNVDIEINLNITVPGTIVNTNIGKINNNQVQINLFELLTQEKISEISIVYKNKSNNSTFINLLIITILLFILYWILRKNK